MKRGRLPLTALRSFEAAGRHLSFSRAADELFVSQAAISRQVRELEDLLAAPLFRRLHRKVELTEAGSALLFRITASFDTIDAALTEILQRGGPKAVRVSVEPALASNWLVPRLNRFRDLRPDIDVLIDVTPRVVDFHGGGPDLALRYSAERSSWPDTKAEHLLTLHDTPMLSPELLRAGQNLTSPADLRNFALLHEENRRYWDRWFELAGAGPTTEPARGPSLADMALVLQAAVRGHGVALGCTFLAHDDLVSGALVAPFPVKIAAGNYWLAARDLDALAEPAKAFADWVRAEFAAFRPLI
ncbi:MAG: LysR substrate-binding domain-containing protein [Rhizobiaceae bacterium]|nr:LysR substrate-binding domain-containing protein [Rhizobiaceae bacterium]